MILSSQRIFILNFAVILAIFADLLFPKAAAAESMVPKFTALAGNSAILELRDDIGQVARLERAKEIKPRKIILVTVTAYSSTLDQTDDSPFVTASGTWVHDGTLAANFLPFGTKVRLPDHFGNKIFVIEDRMNPRFGRRADVWVETREAAKQFGIRRLKMEIF